MAIWDRFFRQVKELTNRRPRIIFNPWLLPPERNERGFLAAYGQIYSLFGIALRIATGVGEVKWRLYKGSERSERSQIADHPILKLLDFANEFQTGQEIMELMQLHLDLVGKAYWYLPKNNVGVPGEVWIIPPHMIRIVPSAKEFISGYVGRFGAENIPFSKDEIIRFAMPDPLNPYGGIGHAQAAAVELDAEDSAGKWNRNFFYNSARADAVLQYEGTLSDEEFEKLREQWQARHGGLGRAHKIAILEGGVEYKQIQITQKDMDFALLRKMTRENLLFTFGMPLSVMGISENVNRANAEAGDYTFARWLVKPRLTRIKNKLNEQLIPMFPLAKDVELDFDEVVPETVEMKKGLAESGVKAGWMTINEARKLNGLDPVSSGEVFLIPFNMMPTPSNKPIKPPPSASPPAPKAFTEEQKETAWRYYIAKTESQERNFKQLLKELFDKQSKEVIRNLHYAASADGALFNLENANEEFQKSFKPLMEQIFGEAAEHAFKQEEFPLDPWALEWLAVNSLELAKQVNGTSLERIRAALVEGFDEGEDVAKLTKRVAEVYGNEFRRRAATLARTEVIKASNEGALWRYEKEGVEKAEFYPAADACEECLSLAGIYPATEAHGRIPVHPNCRCVWLPVV